MNLLFRFNSDGTLKEFTGGNLIQSSVKSDTLYVKVDDVDVSNFVAMAEYKRPDGQVSNDIAMAYGEVPFGLGDGFRQTIPAWCTQLDGQLEITIRLLTFTSNGDKRVFAMAKNVVKVLASTSAGDGEVNITDEQYDALLETLANKSLNEVVGKDVEEYLNQKFEEKSGLIDEYLEEQTSRIENEIDTELKEMDDTIKGLGNLEPSGTAPSSSIISFKDNVGIFIGEDDGNWYYWKASEQRYVVGGVYQATELADGSVTPEKTSFIQCNVQYLEKNKFESGKFYTGVGSSSSNSDYAIYPPIHLKKGTYKFFDLATPFTYITYGNTTIKLSELENLIMGTATEDNEKKIGEFTLENDFTIYITVNNSNVFDTYSNSMLCNDIFPTPNIKEGCTWDDIINGYMEGAFNAKLVGVELDNLEPPHNIIYVGSDKEYTTIKSAVESIKNSSKNNIYDIIIDDGVYKEYAITLPEHVNLIGASGDRSKCIIQGELSDNASTEEITVNSTINLTHSNKLENLTITAKNLRYPIHSESGGLVTDWVQILNNCYVEHLGNTSPNNTWTSQHAWGEGASSGAYAEFNNCVFKGSVEAWYVHAPVNMPEKPKPFHHVLNNCQIINNSISETPSWLSSVGIFNTASVLNVIDFNNCNFGNGEIAINGDDIDVNIHGCNNVAIRREKNTNYPNTDYTIYKTYVGSEPVTKGTVLKYYEGINIVVKANSTTPKEMIAGVCVEDCEPNSIIKLINNTYYPQGGTLGQAIYCNDNGELSTSGTIQIGICLGEFIKIN